jgi:hypothetical protein
LVGRENNAGLLASVCQRQPLVVRWRKLGVHPARVEEGF